MEACRNSGLTVGQWCEENGIAVSTCFSWQRRVFQAVKEVRQAIFAEAPVPEGFHPIGHVIASVDVSGVRMQIYEGADKNTLQAIFQAMKSLPQKEQEGLCCFFYFEDNLFAKEPKSTRRWQTVGRRMTAASGTTTRMESR